jgi:hypothetical protein
MTSWMNQINTVGDLQALLARYNPDTPIRWAAQPRHPLEYTIGQVVCTPYDAAGDGTECDEPPVVWLGADEQVGYLPAPAISALGWSS